MICLDIYSSGPGPGLPARIRCRVCGLRDRGRCSLCLERRALDHLEVYSWPPARRSPPSPPVSVKGRVHTSCRRPIQTPTKVPSTDCVRAEKGLRKVGLVTVMVLIRYTAEYEQWLECRKRECSS